MNAHVLYSLPEFRPIYPIPVPYHVFWSCVPGEGFNNLPGCPAGRGMPGHIEVQHPAPVMAQDHHDEQNLEGDAGHGEEVYGYRVVHVVLEKGRPGL